MEEVIGSIPLGSTILSRDAADTGRRTCEPKFPGPDRRRAIF